MITSKLEIMSGMWCIDDTRIPVKIIKDMYFYNSCSINEIAEIYPHLTKEQIEEAILFKESKETISQYLKQLR